MMHLLINSFHYTIRNTVVQYFLHQNSNIILDTQSNFFRVDYYVYDVPLED